MLDKQTTLGSAATLRRKQIAVTTFTLSSTEHDMSLLDFRDLVEGAMGRLSEFERRSARLSLGVRRRIEGEYIDDVAILNVVCQRAESDDELAARQAASDRRVPIDASLREAKDRVEFARLKEIFEPAAPQAA